MGNRRILRGPLAEAVLQIVKPHAKLAAMMALGAAPIVLIAVLLRPLVLPAVSLMAIAAGGVAVPLAWQIQAQRCNGLTTWDVASGCALIGCAAMLSEPENINGLLGAH